MKKNKATIFDVVKLCGVSRGTVDRVLYGRGKVSEKTRAKVLDAIETLGYKPDVNASRLASRRTYCFAYLIPSFKEGEYWEMMDRGFRSAADEIDRFSISLSAHYYDQNDISSFLKCCDDILEEKPAGLLMNAAFRKETSEFADRLSEAGIPYAFVDNKIDELDYLLYCGVNPEQSGALGAFLLTMRSEPDEICLIRIQRDPSKHADPNGPRRDGFLSFIDEHFPSCQVHSVFIDPSHPEGIFSVMNEFVLNHPQVRHFATTNSRIHLLSDWFRSHPSSSRVVIGFDDIAANMDALREGLVDFLITRHIPDQAGTALKLFVPAVILSQKPSRRNNFVHMDILHQMNMDDYLV